VFLATGEGGGVFPVAQMEAGVSNDVRRSVERRRLPSCRPALNVSSESSDYGYSSLDRVWLGQTSGVHRWTVLAATVDGRAGATAGVGAAGLVHPAPEAVRAAPFVEHPEFFATFDKVQVKYEMLRAHVVAGETVTAAAAAHGYSRASLYLVAHAFQEAGMIGLLDERPGRRGPVKLSAEVLAFLQARGKERPDASGAELARELEQALGVQLHRRTVERALRGRR
jgi:transposase